MTERFDQLMSSLPLPEDIDLSELMYDGEITEDEMHKLMKADPEYRRRHNPLGQDIIFNRVD